MATVVNIQSCSDTEEAEAGTYLWGLETVKTKAQLPVILESDNTTVVGLVKYNKGYHGRNWHIYEEFTLCKTQFDDLPFVRLEEITTP